MKNNIRYNNIYVPSPEREATPRRLAIVGATGSIGRNTVEIVCRYPGLFKARVVTAGSNAQALAATAVRCGARLAVIADESKKQLLASLLEGTGIAVEAGSGAIADSCGDEDVDMAVIASVGYSGLWPTVAAIKAGKDVALANKETLVVAGDYVMGLVRKHGINLIPVDSEHSAVAQCLAGENSADVKRLLITASGGPFRTWTKQQMERATAADALRHPNWSMGAKITIDSATMVNKAFELIEARWLFDIGLDRISPLVHPQSVIHSMVEFTDGSVKAQLGVPDMKLPIAYALGMKSRLTGAEQPLDLLTCGPLTFEAPDYERFPCLGLARTAFDRGGNTACIINAANEVAVNAFIKGQIKFTDIHRFIVGAIDSVGYIANPVATDYSETDCETRKAVSRRIKQMI